MYFKMPGEHSGNGFWCYKNSNQIPDMFWISATQKLNLLFWNLFCPVSVTTRSARMAFAWRSSTDMNILEHLNAAQLYSFSFSSENFTDWLPMATWTDQKRQRWLGLQIHRHLSWTPQPSWTNVQWQNKYCGRLMSVFRWNGQKKHMGIHKHCFMPITPQMTFKN